MMTSVCEYEMLFSSLCGVTSKPIDVEAVGRLNGMQYIMCY